MHIVLHDIVVDISMDRQVNDTFLCQVKLQSCSGKLKHKLSCALIIIRVASNS